MDKKAISTKFQKSFHSFFNIFNFLRKFEVLKLQHLNKHHYDEVVPSYLKHIKYIEGAKK